MSEARILVSIPCHNRSKIAAVCLPTVRAGLGRNDIMKCYDDGSTEYGPNSTEVVKFLSGLGAHWVSWRRYAIGIEKQRREHFKFFGEIQGVESFTHLYLTDADALHDPEWRDHALRLQEKHDGAPLCLYDTNAHVRMGANTIEDDPDSDVIWRKFAPGVSYLLTAAHVAKVLDKLSIIPDDHWNWDWTVPTILGNRFAVSRVGYVDHIGFGGYHHPPEEGYDGGDRVRNPTPKLVEMRATAVAWLKR